MTIARDTFLARTTDLSTQTVFTQAYTVTGSNTAIVIVIEHSSASTVSSVTYAGVALTKVDSVTAYSSTVIDSWLLVGTSTGSNNIVVTFNTAEQGTVTVESYPGVGSGASLGGSDAHNSATFSSSSLNQSISTTTVSNNAWIAVYFRANGGSYSAGTNVSLQDNVANIALMGDTNGAITPAGATTQTFTRNSGTPTGGILTIALKPFSASGANNEPMMHHMQIAGGLT